MSVVRRYKELLQIQASIELAELYLLHVDSKRHFSFGTWESRQHLCIRIGSCGQFGWGEEVASLNRQDYDPEEWGSLLMPLKGLAISEALLWLHGQDQRLPYRLREMVEMALIDLAGKISGKPALELLGLSGREPVPGLYCLLENDELTLKRKTEQAMAQGFRSHIKLKLFGEEELDRRLITSIRGVCGREAYVVGDVNNGYRREHRLGELEELASKLTSLWQAGLSACEDPAMLDVAQWEELQRRVGPLNLIPDVPLRPARTALEIVTPGMGRVFNIHPGAMGSLLDAILLAERVLHFGGRIMVGDNSLIGPACTVWQQVAIGLGASWVEALEKPQEFAGFADTVIGRATSIGQDGLVSWDQPRPGFGLELDADSLQRASKATLRVFD
jgi:L-alanine-DL-glutamate epimerase-like enolase superfamily enzyme